MCYLLATQKLIRYLKKTVGISLVFEQKSAN